MGFFLFPSKYKRLTYLQRLYGFVNGLESWAAPFFKTIDLMLTGLLICLGLPFIHFQNMDQLRLLLRLSCASGLLNWGFIIHLGLTTGYQASLRDNCMIYMNPCTLWSYLSVAQDD
jgi:hypothetical protein